MQFFELGKLRIAFKGSDLAEMIVLFQQEILRK